MKIMIVTANKNETAAVLECKSFQHELERSSDQHDVNYYNVGKWGAYDVVHFQLPTQGTNGANSSALSLFSAISNFEPDAVILLGIAFGKDNKNDKKRTQNIGDVLISEKVADYESGKVRNGTFIPTGAISESGRRLFSAFQYYSTTWEHEIVGRKAACNFGLLLSGDKVVDDKNFKAELLKLFPAAIGGEMEGRGAYAACRNRGLNEWIIVKGISDWADGTKSTNHSEKEKNQKIAAESAVSLVDHVLSDPRSLINHVGPLPLKKNRGTKKNNAKDDANDKAKETDIKLIGFFVNFGVTSCRLFEVYNDKKTLKEKTVITYKISDPKKKEYLNNIIKQVIADVLPNIDASKKNNVFIKAFADSMFLDVLSDERKRNEFIMQFYAKTSLYFNIVSVKQTEENLKRLFGDIGKNTAIINIGSQCVDILVKNSQKYRMYNLPICLNDIKKYLSRHNIGERWSSQDISDMKEYVLQLIKEGTGNKSILTNIKVEEAIIIKNELTFMDDNGYHLIFNNGRQCISLEDYQQDNHELLFSTDYLQALKDKYGADDSKINRYYGFKIGHLMLEAIFEKIGVKTIVPKDELSIHGSIEAYIFNVAISGSTNEGRAKYMLEADRIMREMGATVLSPKVVGGNLPPQTQETDIKHASAIRECDLLFVSNKDGYIGEQTSHEIYGAYLLSKPIAFWKEPNDSFDRLKFIPHERWWNIMKTLEGNDRR